MAVDPKLIDEYEAGSRLLREAIAGMTQQDLLAAPIPGKWSTQQVVIHLMDSDVISAYRMRSIIAEDNPTILPYDETRYANRLGYDRQSIEDAITIFDLNRRQTARMLRGLSAADWERTGNHLEMGTQRLADFLPRYIKHLNRHLDFIHEKRKALGKPLPGK